MTERIETAESRVQEIDELFCQPDYFARTAPDEVREFEEERSGLQSELADLMTEWEAIEHEVAALEDVVEGSG